MEEGRLAKLCRKGDQAALCELYERYAPDLLKICLRYASCRDEAEDVLHDTFIKAFRSMGRFEPRREGSLGRWLRTLAINQSIDRIRQQKKGLEVHLDEIPDECLEPPGSEMAAIGEDVLLRFVAELPPGYRAVFNMYVFDDMPHRDIAKALGITESTSASQFLRAKRMMANRIKQYLKDEQR